VWANFYQGRLSLDSESGFLSDNFSPTSAVRIDAFSRTGFPTKRSTRHDSGLCTYCANTIPSQLEQNRFFLCLKQKFDCRAQKFAVDRGGGDRAEAGISLLEKEHLSPLKLTEKKAFYGPQQ
jgi:hypothetical protein